MTEEQAWFILEHGSYQGLPEYFKAIRKIKTVFESMTKEVEPAHRKVNGEGRLFCGNCGTMIPRWGKYCSECGRKVKRE